MLGTAAARDRRLLCGDCVGMGSFHGFGDFEIAI